MTYKDAINQVTERWQRMGLRPEQAPLTFSSDVDNAMGCICIRFYDGSPHIKTCPCYLPKENPELNRKLNSELKEQFRNGTLSCEEYDS